MKYQILNTGFITLKIYDLLGKEIETVIDAFQKPGIYEVRFNSRNLSSGIYIYTLFFENKKLIKTMVVLK